MTPEKTLNLKNLFFILTKGTGVFTQNSLATVLNTTAKNMNLFVNDGPTAFLKNGFQEMKESIKLTNEICQLDPMQKTKILRTLKEETDLPDKIVPLLDDLLHPDQVWESSDTKEKFKELIQKIIFCANENQMIGSTAKKNGAPRNQMDEKEIPDILQELRDSKMKQLEDQLKLCNKQQYFESFVREKEVNINTDREIWEIKHSIEVIVKNLKEESDIIVFPRRILLTYYDTTYSGYKAFVQSKYRNLSIKVNGKDIKEYYKGFKGYEEEDRDLYDIAFNIRRKELSILDQRSIDMDLMIPLKPKSETRIFIRYVTDDDWSFDRNSFVFRMKLPCRYFKYSCKLVGGGDEWKLFLKAFGDMYKKGSGSFGNEYLHEDSTGASIKVDNWILPYTSGFQEIIRYYKDIHKKDLEYEFVKELNEEE